MKRRLLAACLGVLSLSLMTAGLAMADPLPQVTDFAKWAVEDGTTIHYSISFTLNSPGVVTIDDRMFNLGLDYVSGTALLNGDPVTAENTGRIPTRNTWEFQLGWQDIGVYTLNFDATFGDTIQPWSTVKNWAAIYVDGGWKAEDTVITNVGD